MSVRADPKCLLLYSSSGGRDPYRGIDAVEEEDLLGSYLSGLGLGQGGFAAHGAPVQLELAHARLGEMLVVADWHLLGHASGVVSILRACDATARAVYDPARDQERLPVVVSVSAYCSQEVSHWFRDSDFSIMLALVGPPCDVPNRQLGVGNQTARDDLVFQLLTKHGDLVSWQTPAARPAEFAIVPASLAERIAEAYPGLGCIAYLNGVEDTAGQVRRALEAGAHHVMIDWQLGAVGRKELTVYCRAVTDQLERVFTSPPAAKVVNQQPAQPVQPAQPATASGGLTLV